MEGKKPVKIWGPGEFRKARGIAVRASRREGGSLVIRIRGTAEEEKGGKYGYFFHIRIESYSGAKMIFSRSGMMKGEDLDELLLSKGTAPFGTVDKLAKRLGPGVELRIEMQKKLVERLVHTEKLERKLDEITDASELRKVGEEFDAHWKRVLEMSMDPEEYQIYIVDEGEDKRKGREEPLEQRFLPALTAGRRVGKKKVKA